MRNLRTLIWAYLLLLLFEGALRKWIVPSLDAPLLIVRDPIVMWIYYEAFRNRLSFSNAFFVPNLILGVVTTLLSIAFGKGNLLITYYGIHCDYLQIPLIFLMAQILNRNDVIVMGRFLMYLMLPMTVLVLFQFRSDPDSLVNKGAMHTWYGTVRPSGTFSYIAGLVSYIALVAAFLFYGYLQLNVYRIWLIASVTCAVLLSTFCSGSRSCMVSVGIIVVATILCVVIRGKGGMGIMVAAGLIALAVPLLMTMKIFQDGTQQLIWRFEDAANNGEDTSGFVNRYAESMVQPLAVSGNAETFGAGIGYGTNASAGMMTGQREFIGSEDEWGRLFFECGPIFGLLLVMFRVALTVVIGKIAYDALKRDNPLPLLLYASTAFSLLNGQWGVPTTLGFAIFAAGLTLAACVDPPEDDEEYDEEYEDDVDDEHSTRAGTGTAA